MKVELPAFRFFRTQLQRAYDDLAGSINVRLPLYEDVVTLEGEMNHLGHVILHVTLRYRPDSELLSTLQFKMDIDQSSFPVIIQQIDTIIAEYSS